MKSIPIPSKFNSNEDMLKSCTGYVKQTKSNDITAPQSKRSPKHTERVDVRVEQIL